MKSKRVLLILIIVISIILLVSVDQITKVLIEKNNVELTIIPNVLSITYVQNNGIAFGTQLINRYFIIITNIILIVILGIVMFMDRNKKVELGLLTVVISGAISNVIDRISRGYIIDFIQIKFFNSPVFNFADMYITIGIIIYIFFYIRNGVKESKKEAKENKKDDKDDDDEYVKDEDYEDEDYDDDDDE